MCVCAFRVKRKKISGNAAERQAFYSEAWFFVRSKIPSEGSTGGYIEDKELTHTREEESEKKGTHKRSCCTVKVFFSV